MPIEYDTHLLAFIRIAYSTHLSILLIKYLLLDGLNLYLECSCKELLLLHLGLVLVDSMLIEY